MSFDLGMAYNDADTRPVDLSALTYNELKDRYDSIKTQLDEVDNKYESSDFNWNVDDSKKYKALLEQAEDVQNIMADHPEALKERREGLAVPSQVANLSRTLNTLQERITVTPAALSDPTNRFGYTSDNQFLIDVTNAYTSVGVSDRLQTVLNAVGDDEYSAGDWKAAGVFIPEGFLNQIIRMTPEDDQLLGRMTSVPMSVPSLNIPAAVDKNHSTSYTGGTRVYRTAETRTTTKSRDTFEKVKMEASELVGESAVTKELLRYSSISIPALIQNSQSLAMKYKRQDEIIVGDGQGKYLGFLNPANLALKSVQRKVSQATGDIINGRNILEMKKHVWGYNEAVWVFNHDLFEEIAQLHIESDNNAGIIKMYSPETGDTPERLLGRPIVWTEFMPGIQSGQDGNIHSEWGDSNYGNHFAACVNMSVYYHGQLYSDQAVSAHVRFSEREEVFQFVTADDARPSWLTSLTPKRGVTTRSPFVALETTAAT
jgi:HK97 family phage major capsid protein